MIPGAALIAGGLLLIIIAGWLAIDWRRRPKPPLDDDDLSGWGV